MTADQSLSHHKAYAYLFLACLFWGAHFIIAKMILPDFPPITLTMMRWVPAALIAFICFRHHWQQQLHLMQQYGLVLSLFAIFGIVLFPVTLYYALLNSQLITLALYISATPLVIALMNAVLFRDRINLIMAIAILVSFFGVILLITRNDPLSLLQITLTKGDLWALAAALSWSGYCLLFRVKPKLLTHQSFLISTLLIGSLLLIPLSLWELSGSDWSFSTPDQWGWLGLIYIILFPSFGSYYFWNQGLAVIGSNKGSQFNHLVPLIAVTLGIIFLGNVLLPHHLSGAACILIAIMISIFSHLSTVKTA